MAGVLALYVEDRQGRPQGPQPRWRAQRQFLWEIVHDTRGVLRHRLTKDEVDVVRRIDRSPTRDDEAMRQDPAAVRAVYEKVVGVLTSLSTDGPTFRWIAREGSEDWAAVQHLTEAGEEVALVGGWHAPILRNLGEEGGQRALPDSEELSVGERRFRVRRTNLLEMFQPDIDSLLKALASAEHDGHHVRFVEA